MDLVALGLNILSKLVIVLVCLDTARKEGTKSKVAWYILGLLWLVQVLLIVFVGFGTDFAIYLYLVIGFLTIRVSDTLKGMRRWAKLIEWSGAGLIGATLCYMVYVM